MITKVMINGIVAMIQGVFRAATYISNIAMIYQFTHPRNFSILWILIWYTIKYDIENKVGKITLVLHLVCN